MNVNKKLGRFKQWAGERMGGEARTNVSDDFKSLELEMNLRHEGTIMRPESVKVVSLTLCRHAAFAEIHDHIRQNPLETERRGRQGKVAASLLFRVDYGPPWGGF